MTKASGSITRGPPLQLFHVSSPSSCCTRFGVQYVLPFFLLAAFSPPSWYSALVMNAACIGAELSSAAGPERTASRVGLISIDKCKDECDVERTNWEEEETWTCSSGGARRRSSVALEEGCH